MEEKRRKNISSFARCMNLGCMVSLTGQKTIFPFYHVVSGVALPHIKHLYYYRDEAEFEHDLDGMLKMFAPISIDQYLNGESGSRTKKQMVLSFDDGLVECHQFIAPLLKQKGVPALFFLNNNFIDNRGMFFRYRASILIEKLLSDDGALTEAAGYLVIPEDQVVKAILMIRYNQQPLLDALVTLVDIDYSAYLTHQKVYMSSEQVKDLIGWGFHLGAHSMDHQEFSAMKETEMVEQVRISMGDLQDRFEINPSCFAFPFTSEGVPMAVIDQLFKEGIAKAIFGTAGLKKTGMTGFIQRIPMETMDLPALRVLKAEYLYYLMKAPLGRNKYKGR